MTKTIYVHTIPDSLRAGTKIIPDRALFTHKNGCGGAISVTERSRVAAICKVESQISDRCSHYKGWPKSLE